MKGAIRVFARIRPKVPREADQEVPNRELKTRKSSEELQKARNLGSIWDTPM